MFLISNNIIIYYKLIKFKHAMDISLLLAMVLLAIVYEIPTVLYRVFTKYEIER